MSFKTIRNYTIIAVIALLAGRFILQPQPKVKEVIVYVEKKEDKKATKKTSKTRERKNPDGSTETETEVTEETSSSSSTSVNSQHSKAISKGISVGILAIKDISEFSKKTEVGAVVSVPVFGSLSIIGSADTTKRVGLGLSLEF